MATLKELSDNPELATQEEINDLRESIKLLLEIGKRSDYYKGSNGEMGVAIKKIAYSYYIDYSIYSAILNAFWGKEMLTYVDISKQVFAITDEEFRHKITIPKYQSYLLRLCWLELIKCTDEGDGDEATVRFQLTEKGRESLRQQTYANIAQSALFNIQACRINEESLKINRNIKHLTIMGVAIAIVAILIPLVLTFIK